MSEVPEPGQDPDAFGPKRTDVEVFRKKSPLTPCVVGSEVTWRIVFPLAPDDTVDTAGPTWLTLLPGQAPHAIGPNCVFVLVFRLNSPLLPTPDDGFEVPLRLLA